MLKTLMAIAALGCTAVQLRRMRTITMGTTTEVPRRWALGAVAMCACAAFLLSSDWRLVASVTQALAAIMLLTPFIAVLGARRPGADVWSWFILLPLVVVLLWPVLAELPRADADQKLLLPLPTVLGFLFVLLMGAGNYFGTQNTAAALVAAVGVLLVLSGTTEFAANDWTYVAGCICMALSTRLIPTRLFTDSQPAQSADSTLGPNRLWGDFRDLFGIVWAKRVMPCCVSDKLIQS